MAGSSSTCINTSLTIEMHLQYTCHNAIVLEKGAQRRETRKNSCMRSTFSDKIFTIWLESVTTVVEQLVISYKLSLVFSHCWSISGNWDSSKICCSAD